MGMKNIIFIFILIGIAIVYLRYIEYKSLYVPMSEIELTPSAVGLSYEDMYIDVDKKIRLNAWIVPAKDSNFTILFCHGNAGNISHRIEKVLILNRLGLDVFIFDYRGYGKSKGRPSEKGLYKDAESAYDFLVSKLKLSPERIIFYGESLGGAVAVDLATKRKVRALIIESTFGSVQDMLKTVYPFLPAFFISSKFDSTRKIKYIHIPKLIINSQNDEIVPFSQSIKLFNISPEPKKHLVIMGSHNTCFQDSKDLYVSGINDFITDLLDKI